MKLSAFRIYFVALDGTINHHYVRASHLRGAIIKASAKQMDNGMDCNFFKVEIEERERFDVSFSLLFNYGEKNPKTLTY